MRFQLHHSSQRRRCDAQKREHQKILGELFALKFRIPRNSLRRQD